MSSVDCDKDCKKKKCDYQAKSSCAEMPLVWGEYCNYEIEFIQTRYNDLLTVYKALQKFFNNSKAYGGYKFHLNHTTLWHICYIYANDLKPVRQFHAIDGGCDRNRRAAFLARLVAMHRPIQVDEFIIPNNKALQDDLVLKLNELFAINTLMHFLVLPETFFADARVEKVAADLMFIFGHRDPQPESLVSIARLMTGLYEEYKRTVAAEARIRELEAQLQQTLPPADV